MTDHDACGGGRSPLDRVRSCSRLALMPFIKVRDSNDHSRPCESSEALRCTTRRKSLFGPLATLAFAAGCCVKPSSAWDRSPAVRRDNVPGVVAIVKKVQRVSGCTGTVVSSVPHGTGFDTYVLTARHCTVDHDDHLIALAVGTPADGDDPANFRSPIFDAVVAYSALGDESESVGTVVWETGDWAILRAATPSRWPALRLYQGDPARYLHPGEQVALLSYADGAFRDHSFHLLLQAHEHPFAWTGLPPQVEQGGHSGAPVLREGEVIGVFTGATENSRGCQLVCRSKWPTKLRFVNVAAIRAQARLQGFEFSAGSS